MACCGCIWLLARAAHAAPFVYALGAAVQEGNTGTTDLVFNVVLSEASAKTVTVDYSTMDVTATAGSDYGSTFGVAIFSPGILTQFVSVSIQGDLLNEADETLLLRLTNAVNATLLNDHAFGTILNDDPPSSLSIGNATVVEGDTGTTNAVLQVNLNPASGQTVTVDYLTVDGTAVAGADYLMTADTLTFLPGSTNTTISVPVYGDLLNEATETFSVLLTNSMAATLTNGVGVVTIIDDDPLPNLTIADATVLEGNTGTTNAAFLVSLAPPSGQSVSVNYATAPGTAFSGTDFVAANGSLIFAAGTTNLAINVAVVGDTQIEPNKTFLVTLSAPTNASLARTQAIGTILDDEVRTLAFTNAAPIVGADFGAGAPYPSSIEISGITGTVVAVTATLQGLTHTSPDDLDILLVGPGGQRVLLMSDAGGITPVTGLTLGFSDSAGGSLPDSSALVSGVFKPTNYGAGDTFSPPAPAPPFGSVLALFNGLNPNGTWSLYVYDDAGGNSGTLTRGWSLGLTLSNLVCCAGSSNTDLSVTVTDSPDPISATSNLTYTIRVINNGPANATGVFLTNTLPAGTGLISVSPSQGTNSQNGQAAVCNLGNLAVGAMATVGIVASPNVIAMLTNVATVVGNEPDPNLANNTALTPTAVQVVPVTITIADVSVAEGDNGITNAVFTVSLSRTNNLAVNVDFSTADATAQAGSDYVAEAGTLTWPAGTTNQTIAVPVYGDRTIEANETFTVSLQNPVNAVLGRAAATGTILNDDGLPGVVDHFTWSTVASPQLLEQPFSVSVTARDVSNNTVAGFNQPVLLKGQVGSGPEVSIVIAEIDTADNDRVEFANVSGSPINLSGWQITLYDWVSWPEPEFIFTVPAGTVAAPNDLFLLTDNGTGPGTYPNFFSGINLYWDNSETNNALAVLLQDASGGIVDFACAFDPDISQIAFPLPIPLSQWSGAPIVANTNAAKTFQRVGNSDSNNSNNWVIADSTIGTVNPGLISPFVGTLPVAVSPGTISNFSAGVWSGNVAVLQTGSGISLRATDLVGHTGNCNAFNVDPAADLALSLRASTNVVPAGQPLSFIVSVTNPGPSSASAIFVTNMLPVAFNFSNATPSQGTWSRNGNTVTASLGTLAKGSSATLTVTGSFTSGGSFTNYATAAGALADPQPSNNSGTLEVTVTVNHPPSIDPIPTQAVDAGNLLALTVQASDPDPGDTLSFSLGPGAPAGASLSAAGGFSWTPSLAQAPSTNLITVQVADNGSPSLSATQTFLVYVLVPVEPPVIDQLEHVPARYEIRFKGQPGYDYQVQFADPPATNVWQTLTNVLVPEVQLNATISQDGLSHPQRSYRVNPTTRAEALPQIVPRQTPDGRLALELEGNAGHTYTVEYNDSVAAGAWRPLTNVTFTSQFVDFIVVDPLNQTGRAYRVTQFSAAPPVPFISRIERDAGGVHVTFPVEAGFSYAVEFQDALGSTGWTTLTTIPAQLQPAVFVVSDSGLVPTRYYRLNVLLAGLPVSVESAGPVPEGWLIHFRAKAGQSYTVQYNGTLDPQTWQTLQTIAPLAGDSALIVPDYNAAGKAQRFYRLRIP